MFSPSKKIYFRDFVFLVWANVYEPAEDSFLFAENLIVNEGEVVLDMGTGCGILGIIAAEKASAVVALDVNPYAIRCAKENARLNGVLNKMFFIQGDLFKPLAIEEKYGMILFNAPYLPSTNLQEKSWLELAWSGGDSGRCVIDRFIHEAPFYLKKSGRVLLLQSTLCNADETVQKFKESGLNATIIAKCDLPFFESIILFEARFGSSNTKLN